MAVRLAVDAGLLRVLGSAIVGGAHYANFLHEVGAGIADRRIRYRLIKYRPDRRPNPESAADQLQSLLRLLHQALADQNSIYHFFRKLLELRKQTPALIYRDYQALDPQNPSVFAYTRTLEPDKYLVVSESLKKRFGLHTARLFSFALPCFAGALKVFDRKGGPAEDRAIPGIDGGSFFGKQTPHGENQSLCACTKTC